MHKILPFFLMLALAGAVTLLSVAAGGSTPASAGPQYGSSDAEYSTVADVAVRLNLSGNRRVCCKRGWRDWWSTWRECRRVGGHQVANRECRNDRADYRVCCKRGHRDWWSTLRECRRAGGYQVANRECRRD